MISAFLMRLPNLASNLEKTILVTWHQPLQYKYLLSRNLSSVLTGECLGLFTMTVLLFSNEEYGTRFHQ